jgi:hypothetical protein
MNSELALSFINWCDSAGCLYLYDKLRFGLSQRTGVLIPPRRYHIPLKEFVVLGPSREHEKPHVTYGPRPAQAGPERGPE